MYFYYYTNAMIVNILINWLGLMYLLYTIYISKRLSGFNMIYIRDIRNKNKVDSCQL